MYGPGSVLVPIDDCPRIWLACGPTNDLIQDETHAMLRYLYHKTGGHRHMTTLYESCTPEEAQEACDSIDDAIDRREQALRLGHVPLTYTQAISFLAKRAGQTRSETG